MRAQVGGASLRIQFQHEEGEWPLSRSVRRKKRKKLTEKRKLAEVLRESTAVVLVNKGYFGSEAVVLAAADYLDPPAPAATRRTIATILEVHGDHEHVLAEGIAYLSPKDRFDKETGRQIALERALIKLPAQQAGALLSAYVRRPGAPFPAWEAWRSPEAHKLAMLVLEHEFPGEREAIRKMATRLAA